MVLPAALNITSTRQRLPAAVTQSGSPEGEPRTTVTHPGLIERAAVVVPKLKADSSAADAGERHQSARPSAASSVHSPARPYSCLGLWRTEDHVCSLCTLCRRRKPQILSTASFPLRKTSLIVWKTGKLCVDLNCVYQMQMVLKDASRQQTLRHRQQSRMQCRRPLGRRCWCTSQ